MAESSNNNNVIPRHLTEHTYSRLKDQYAPNLYDKWLDKTEPSKHVLDDIIVAALLIELWRNMYGVVPASEVTDETRDSSQFPGFVDIACGNGVVVYVLLMEGYSGYGLDARRRETWTIFPKSVQEKLKERICIPKPFLDATNTGEIGADIHTGDFPPETFIISNRADEMTVWTPLMAALSCLASPLPFLAIPCCSHSLSGTSYRYPAPANNIQSKGHGTHLNTTQSHDDIVEQAPQPASGDLRALRLAKDKEKNANGRWDSMYGSLTAKAMSIAEEIGFEVEVFLLPLSTTRNMGVVGGRQLAAQQWKTRAKQRNLAPASVDHHHNNSKTAELIQKITEITQRECSRDGGIQNAARAWIERAQSLNSGQSSGNQAH
ncbi:tRNA(Ser) Um(44) 2'-O-methyltransferase [Penicillium angulare]|uniref:tRNA(Ser) Um(44) 2'-O-methyltransferase n=1 Tax=Penicillium angulare TaxID=116970 RepID=UPI0025408461|nr:tRNA(Ser) Um(44) 2'-O-methyltransferase [Penicillium angulare]KAJ5263276.1 tRNA(Ser) Um(44) 2'-O-methyltransferase [Penicillium angulare]